MASISDEMARRIDEALAEIRPQLEQLLSAPADMQAHLQNDLCSRITSKSKTLLHGEIILLTDAYMEGPLLATTQSKNKFWDRNLSQDIFSHYDFNYTLPSANFPAQTLFPPIISATGALVLGGALAFALNSSIILPFAAVIAAALFFIVKKIQSMKSQNMRSMYISNTLADLKKQLLEWFASVEKYFDDEVKKLVRSEE